MVKMSAFGAFGLTTSTAYYTVDSGSGLVFKVDRTNGNIPSIAWNGTELNDTGKASSLSSGLGSGGTVVTATADLNTVMVTVATDGSNGVVANLTHYYIVRNGVNNIYMATFVTTEPNVGELRWITRLQGSLFPTVPNPSEIRGNTGAIESADVFGFADGTTRSKYFGNQRAKDITIRGVVGSGRGVFMADPNRESSSGGPFARDIQNQTGSDAEVYNYMNSGHAKTEEWRLGVLNGPYALCFNDGATIPAVPDMSFLAGLGLTGYVAPSGRGVVTCNNITGRDTAYTYTVGFANTTAQYWTDPSATEGSFTSPAMKPGTYTMQVYKNELSVYTDSNVTVSAGSATVHDPIAITGDPSTVFPLWRIGNWDGTPLEFLYADKVTTMHPSDVRISGTNGTAAWAPGPYVIGTSAPATGLPCYQWNDVNSNQVVQFNLNSNQLVASTVRIGITTAFAGGRPNISVNSWSNTKLPSASSQPDSRTMTVGTYRGNNFTYTYSVPASALVAGTNTLTFSPISGSSGTAYLSPGYGIDSVDMYQGTAQTLAVPSAPANVNAVGGDGQVTLSWSAVSGAFSYNVLRGMASGGPYTTVASSVPGTSFNDPGLNNGTTYYYLVTSSNSSGTGVSSIEASGTPVTAATPTPTASPTPTDTPTPIPTSTPATPTPTPATPTPAPSPSTLGNISTRLSVGTGDNVLIGGFIINGTQPKKVLVRATGPSLSKLNVSGALADPTLTLVDGNGIVIATNDDWLTDVNAAQIPLNLQPGNPKESAVLITLVPGSYTAIVSGVGGTTGLALVEGFDLDQTVDSKLANISTRGLVQTGDNVIIGGLIIQGSTPAKVILRGRGPTLPGVANPLLDPTLDVFDVNGVPVASNDNWQSDPGATEITADNLAPGDAREAATLQILAPGNYTAIVRGANGSTGVGLVEVFNLQ